MDTVDYIPYFHLTVFFYSYIYYTRWKIVCHLLVDSVQINGFRRGAYSACPVYLIDNCR